MIVLNFTLILAVLIYVSLAFRDKTRTKQTAVFDPRLKTWRRDMTAHEIKIYNEMRRHWQKQAKITYKKIRYEHRNTT
jgi:hypothetical protein